MLHVEDVGRGQPLLALHGLGGGAWFFSGFARRLSPEYRVIAVDLPGTGRSTSRVPFSIPTWIADLGELLEAHVGERVALVGHSMGTIVSLQAWAAWPDRISSLIFVGGLPEPRPAIKERLAARAQSVLKTGLAGVGPEAAAANFARATLERQPELVALWEVAFEAQDPAVYVRWCGQLIAASAAAILPTVTAPCVSISGAEDQYAPPDLVREFVARLPRPVHTEVLPDCGHLPFLEQPDAFAGAVRSFLAALC